jgi:hypothetical protein
MRVGCSVEETLLPGDRISEVPGVKAVCGRCSHEATAFGCTNSSVWAALAKLKKTCPNEESNFYVDQEYEPERPKIGLLNPWKGTKQP